jgi:DNA polymerase III alpha subunit
VEHLSEFCSKLHDRTLWYDGDTSVSPNVIKNYIGQPNLYVTELTSDIVKYNRLVDKEQRIHVKTDCVIPDKESVIPIEYKQLEVVDYILDKFKIHCKQHKITKKQDIVDRLKRINEELILFEQYNMFDLVRTLVYIINTFEENNVVWGVGRGSSTSSYILFLIGVHDIDSYQYQLDIRDFIKEN